MNREPLNPEPRIPIIALTAAVMEADRRMAREAGVDGHLAKRRMAHTLKGVAGLVRAERLTAAAVAIDLAIKHGRVVSAELREELAAALDQVRVGLEKVPDPGDGGQERGLAGRRRPGYAPAFGRLAGR